MNWVDIAGTIFLVFSALNGWRRGLVNELSGFVALLAAGFAGLAYQGQLDGFMHASAHLGPGSAHVAGLVATASIAYLIVWAIGFALDRVAKLPVLNIVNAGLGGVLAVGKTVVILTVLCYIAALAPLPEDVHTDLQRSHIAQTLGVVNGSIDSSLEDRLPSAVRPFWEGTVHHRDGGGTPEPIMPFASPVPG